MLQPVFISLIIPTKDRQAILLETLGRLKQVHLLDKLEVLVINDSTQELLLPPSFSFARVLKNRGSGVAAARNFGATQAAHDWLVFMDDDMWVQPNTFELLMRLPMDDHNCLNINWIYPPEIMSRYQQLPFLRYLHHFGFDSLQGWSSDIEWKTDKPFRVKGITSQFLVMHRTTFEKVGGYDTSFPFAGFEDHDLSARLRRYGIPVFVDPQNMIFHNEADRLGIQQWLERKWRGAVTRRVGVQVGYKELQLQYGFAKYAFYKLVYTARQPLLWLLRNWLPSFRPADRIFFLLVNILLGTYSCIGYTGKEALNRIKQLQAKD